MSNNIIEISKKRMIANKIFKLAKKAEAKKQKNNGLVNSVNFEFDDQRTL